MTKILQELRTTNEEASWVVPWLTQTNPRWRQPPSLIWKKISITQDWIKISAPNFMGRCITATWPKVNSRDVIKWMSEGYVHWSLWQWQIFEPNLAQNTNTTLSTRRNGQIHINYKSKMAAAAIFRKMSITQDWIQISAPNYMGKCTTAMRRWPHD